MTKRKQLLFFFFADFAFLSVSGGYFLLFLLGVIPPGICIFPRLFGLYCPACGGTRAMAALVMGHPVLSLLRNPAAAVFVAATVYYEIAVFLRICRGRGRIFLFPLIVLGAVLVCQFAVRNILLRFCLVDFIGDFLPPPAFLSAL